MSDRALRCLVADDHPALVAAVSTFLEARGFDVVAQAADGYATLLGVQQERPDVALVDYRMPRLEGPALLARLQEEAPDTLVAVYTAAGDDQLVRAAFEAGARAVVLKDAPLADLVLALQTICAGGHYIDPALARDTLAPAKANGPGLTQRETEVLALLADGLSHEQIGKELSISAETVRTHVRKACERLNARTRTQAVATALRLGLLA
ncbi:MAG TPA: response regulator transcription factor [Gaiellaceae bacterium]|jgi:two-component system nitrate/nitrite response regulator NarL|nr:response regulator transcription factor [Gaiellaceae bacterium]